jgi:hypothetical protein
MDDKRGDGGEDEEHGTENGDGVEEKKMKKRTNL